MGLERESAEAVVRRLSWRKRVVYALLPAVVLFAVLETAARVLEIWYPAQQVDIGLGFTPDVRLFVADPGAPGMMTLNPQKAPFFHPASFTLPKAPGTFRIFAMGGSSVNYLQGHLTKMAERLHSRFQERCPHLEIINAGGLSYGSQRNVLIAAEIVQYAPDLVLLYCGHNEFEDMEQMQYAQLRMLPLQRVLAKSAFCRFLRDRIGFFNLRLIESEHNRRIARAAVGASTGDRLVNITEADVPVRMRDYENNLAIITQIFQDHHIPLIIGTTPSNLWRPWLGGEAGNRFAQEVLPLYEAGRYDEGVALLRSFMVKYPRKQASDTENGIIRKTAAEFGLELVDVERAVIDAEPHHVPGETLFKDECHLNDAGNDLWAACYEPVVIRFMDHILPQ